MRMRGVSPFPRDALASVGIRDKFSGLMGLSIALTGSDSLGTGVL